MTTPAACFPTFLIIPSSFLAISKISSACSSVFKVLFKSLFLRALSSVISGEKGIIFASLSAKLYDFPCALATSLTTALAAIVPKVQICATASFPYF